MTSSSTTDKEIDLTRRKEGDRKKRKKDAGRRSASAAPALDPPRPEPHAGIFAAVRDLDAEDSRAERKRHRHRTRASRQSEAARSQVEIYWTLVECRILLQRSAAAQNPEPGRRPGRSTGAALVSQCNVLLAKLLEARRLLLGGDDDDDEGNGSVDYEAAVRHEADPKRSPKADLAALLQAEHESAREGWKEVLNRRQRDVKLHSGLTSKTQYKVLDSTFWQQVEATAAHEQQRHELRARPSAPSSADATAPAYTVAEFDDSKLYQQLLKDFVSSHRGSSSSAALERLQKNQRRSASGTASHGKAAAVDRKASKGRKIRFHDIPKLQHFTFPIGRCGGGGGGGGGGTGMVGGGTGGAASLLDEDEWFRSLFGGAESGGGRSA